MYLLLMFGIGMVSFGCFMVCRPMQFSRGIVQFSEKPWFHAFEIVSRGLFGVLFLLAADSTAYPNFVTVLGGILCFASVLLFSIGPARHQRFALMTAKIGKTFRLLGLIAIAGGVGLIYLGLA